MDEVPYKTAKDLLEKYDPQSPHLRVSVAVFSVLRTWIEAGSFCRLCPMSHWYCWRLAL